MMFRLTLKFGLHRFLRTDQRRKSRTPCNVKVKKLTMYNYGDVQGSSDLQDTALDKLKKDFLHTKLNVYITDQV